MIRAWRWSRAGCVGKGSLGIREFKGEIDKIAGGDAERLEGVCAVGLKVVFPIEREAN